MSIALTPTNNHHKMKNLFIAIFLFSPLFLLAQEQGQTQETASANADEALQDTVKLKEIVVKFSKPISKINPFQRSRGTASSLRFKGRYFRSWALQRMCSDIFPEFRTTMGISPYWGAELQLSILMAEWFAPSRILISLEPTR